MYFKTSSTVVSPSKIDRSPSSRKVLIPCSIAFCLSTRVAAPELISSRNASVTLTHFKKPSTPSITRVTAFFASRSEENLRSPNSLGSSPKVASKSFFWFNSSLQSKFSLPDFGQEQIPAKPTKGRVPSPYQLTALLHPEHHWYEVY